MGEQFLLVWGNLKASELDTWVNIKLLDELEEQ